MSGQRKYKAVKYVFLPKSMAKLIGALVRQAKSAGDASTGLNSNRTQTPQKQQKRQKPQKPQKPQKKQKAASSKFMGVSYYKSVCSHRVPRAFVPSCFRAALPLR